jgi:molecular chaperone GrpE
MNMEDTKKTAEETVEETVSEETATAKETKAEKKQCKKLEAEIADLQKALAAKEEALAAENDKYMRMIAEYDNYRRRSAKEKESTYADAYGDVLLQILPVLDTLERAASYAPQEGAGAEAEAILQGLRLTLKSFADTLAKLGVTEIEALGKTFDPNLHNAVMHVEDEQYGESEIVEVLQKGYAKGDKILRYAMVKVAN